MLKVLATGKSAHETLGPVAQKILANPNISIKLVVGVDDICAPCKYWDHALGRCMRYPEDNPLHQEYNEKNLMIDKNAIHALGMKEGDVMGARELYSLIKEKVSKKVFVEEVCWACMLVDQCGETYEQDIEATVEALNLKFQSEVR